MFSFSNYFDSYYTHNKDFLRIENSNVRLFMELNPFRISDIINKFRVSNYVLHYYNDISLTKWPYFLSMAVFFLIPGIVLSFVKVFFSVLFLVSYLC